MKKSEATKAISEILDGFCDAHMAHTAWNDETAEKILDKMLVLGMRPPVSGSIQSQIAAVHNEWENE
jgi:hypothetical protein